MNLERIDLHAEREVFIYIKRTKSTRAAYSSALRIFEEWLVRKSLALSDITPRLASDFISDVKENGWTDSSGTRHATTANKARAIVAACSSFYTHLEGRFTGIKNPFRGVHTSCIGRSDN
jgi:site-specific recombinase XerD